MIIIISDFFEQLCLPLSRNKTRICHDASEQRIRPYVAQSGGASRLKARNPSRLLNSRKTDEVI